MAKAQQNHATELTNPPGWAVVEVTREDGSTGRIHVRQPSEAAAEDFARRLKEGRERSTTVVHLNREDGSEARIRVARLVSV